MVIYLPDCHESIAGIIAGRLREKYAHPFFVLTKAEEGLKGSGRSIEAYHMYEGLHGVEDLLTKYGGHKLAAGLSLEEKNLQELRRRLNADCHLTEEDFVHKISDKEYLVEGSVNLDDFNDRLELNLESEDYDSLGGFIIEHLDRLPELGDSITTEDGIRLVVESLDKNRIEKVHVYLPEKTESDEDFDE